jgi:hypothetical protein
MNDEPFYKPNRTPAPREMAIAWAHEERRLIEG